MFFSGSGPLARVTPLYLCRLNLAYYRAVLLLRDINQHDGTVGYATPKHRLYSTFFHEVEDHSCEWGTQEGARGGHPPSVAFEHEIVQTVPHSARHACFGGGAHTVFHNVLRGSPCEELYTDLGTN